MQQATLAFQFYTTSLANLSKKVQQLKKRSVAIAWLRFGVFIITAFIGYKIHF